MISILVYVLVVAIVAGLAYWLVDALPVPQPLNRIVKMIIVVVCVLALIWLLLGVAGNPPTLPR